MSPSTQTLKRFATEAVYGKPATATQSKRQ
jgi:hypothetical protein